MAMELNFSRISGELKERIVPDYKKYDSEYSTEKSNDEYYGIRPEEFSDLEKRLKALPLSRQEAVDALHVLMADKDYSVRNITEKFECVSSDEAFLSNLSIIIAKSKKSLDDFILYVSNHEKKEYVFSDLHIYTSNKESVINMNKHALRLAKTCRPFFPDNESGSGMYDETEFIKSVMWRNPGKRSSALLKNILKLGWKGRNDSNQNVIATNSFNRIKGRDLTRTEYEIARSALPIISDPDFVEGMRHTEINGMRIGDRIESYGFSRIMKIFSMKPYSHWDDREQYYVSWDDETKQKLLDEGRINERGFPITSPSRLKRNTFSLLRALLERPSQLYALESLEDDIVQFSTGSKTLVDIVKGDILNEKRSKNIRGVFPKLKFLLRLNESQLKFIRSIQKSGKLIYNSYNELNYIVSTPKSIKKTLTETFMASEDRNQAFHNLTNLVDAFREDNSFIQDLTYIVKGRREKLSLKKSVDFVKENASVYSDMSDYDSFNNFLRNRKKILKDPSLVNKISDLTGLKATNYKEFLEEIKTRYTTSAMDYFRSFVAHLNDFPESSERAKTMVRTLIDKRDDAGTPLYGSDSLYGLFSSIKEINDERPFLFDLAERTLNEDMFGTCLSFISSFNSYYKNLGEEAIDSILTYVVGRRSKRLMHSLSYNFLNNETLEKYVGTLSKVPAIGIKRQIDILLQLNKLSIKTFDVKGMDYKELPEDKEFSVSVTDMSLNVVLDAINLRNESAKYTDFKDIELFLQMYNKVMYKFENLPKFDFARLESIIGSYAAYDSASLFQKRITNLDDNKKRDKSLTGMLVKLLENNPKNPEKIAKKIVNDFYEAVENRRDVARFGYVMDSIKKLYSDALEKIVRMPVSENKFIISEDIENIVLGYISTSYSKEIRPFLRRCLKAYMVQFMESVANLELNISLREKAHTIAIRATNKIVHNLKDNKRILSDYNELGYNTNLWTSPFTMEYDVKPFDDPETVKDRLRRAEIIHIRRCLDHIGYDAGQMNDNEIFSRIKEIMDSEDMRSADNVIKEELKSHVRNLRRNDMLDLSSDASVRFYVSEDLFDNFNMGTYVNSCTSLISGSNKFNGFVSGIDINKKIIYAKSGDKIVGRNLSVFTREGMVPNEFYDLANLNTDDLWVDFLDNYSSFLGMPLLVPAKFVNSQKADRLMENGYSLKNIRTVLDKAVFSHYYNNGFNDVIEISPEGNQLEFEAYAK